MTPWKICVEKENICGKQLLDVMKTILKMIIFKSQAILITYSNVYIGGGVCLFPLYNFFLFSFSFMGGVAFHPKSVNLLTYSPHATWDVCFMNFMTTHNNFVFRNYSILHFQLKLFILDSFTIFL